MAEGNNKLLIFDFDNTITNGHMHNYFGGLGISDFNSAVKDAVTDADIGKFLEGTGGIKNEKELKSALQSALSNGIEVNIASFTGYPNAVKRVVENHLGLSKEQADSVSIFGHLPKHYDSQLPEIGQQNQFGKNLHICKAIVEYKDKHGQLPKTVMLVDDDKTNIEKIKKFVESMSERDGWLKENGLSIEDIQKIEFKGVQAPMNRSGKVAGDTNYLGRIQELISANLVQEPIYENLKKEEPIYQNLQDIQRQSSEEKSPSLPPNPENSNVEAKSPLPPKKRKLNKVHTANGVAANGKNEEQIYTQNISVPVVKETEVHFPYCSELDLETPMQRLRDSFQKDDLPEKAIHAIYSLFKEKVIKAIREQGDRVIEKSEVLYIKSRHRHNNDSKITDDSFTQIMAQIQEKKKEIKDLASNYQGEDLQLRKEISELLNVNLQKTDIHSNYVTINQSEGQQAAAFPRRYIKVTQDNNTGNNTSERDKREKGKKTDYRNNNRTENSTATKENRTERVLSHL